MLSKLKVSTKVFQARNVVPGSPRQKLTRKTFERMAQHHISQTNDDIKSQQSSCQTDSLLTSKTCRKICRTFAPDQQTWVNVRTVMIRRTEVKAALEEEKLLRIKFTAKQRS